MPEQDRPTVSVVFGGMHGTLRNVAQAFHDAGDKVIIVDKREAPEDGDTSYFDHVVAADLMDETVLADVAARIAACYGHVSNLVFGLRYRGPEEDVWRGETMLNLTVPHVMIDNLSDAFVDGGAIVLISSTAGRRVTPNTSLAYQCTKAAADQMVRYYAYHLGPKGIRVNAVSPCYIVKDESIKFFMANEDVSKDAIAAHPLKRIGRADDIADMTAFLCSDKATFVTGQIIEVDGGLSLPQPGIPW